MIHSKQNSRLRIRFAGTVIGIAFCSSTAVLASALEEPGWAKTWSVPTTVRQEPLTIQQFDGYLTSYFPMAVPTQQQRVRMTPIDTQGQQRQQSAEADQPEPTPAQPGLPPPPMPEPAAPHLAPAPPPMPQPAEPPPLSQRPDLNPANPGAPEQQPASPPQAEPEPTAYRGL